MQVPAVGTLDQRPTCNLIPSSILGRRKEFDESCNKRNARKATTSPQKQWQPCEEVQAPAGSNDASNDQAGADAKQPPKPDRNLQEMLGAKRFPKGRQVANLSLIPLSISHALETEGHTLKAFATAAKLEAVFTMTIDVSSER